MILTKSQRTLIAIAAAIIIFFILGFLGIIPIFKHQNGNNPSQQITLTMWGIDDPSWIKPLISAYTATRFGTKIEYTQISPQSYESELLNAMATNKGPDIIMFHRSWLEKHGDKVSPVDPTQFSITELNSLFPDIIEKDFTREGYIYALPLYLDSLALFYNKDIFNAKGISLTPQTWSDFKNLASFLTDYDLSHKIKKSGAAIGGSQNAIETAPDILALLMMQQKSNFIDSSSGKTNIDNQAITAFNSYLDFTNTNSPYYIWDDSLGNYLDLFAFGKTAMIFDYAKSISRIKQKNPLLNFTITPVPQLNNSEPKNCVDYWGLTVTRQSANKDQAWSFIFSSTANDEPSEAYLKAANLPPALRTLINKYQTDPSLNAFAKQALTASFYTVNRAVFNPAISNAITNVLSGKTSIEKALSQAAAEINVNK